jgi:peptidoglycan lytic transglycosylase A
MAKVAALALTVGSVSAPASQAQSVTDAAPFRPVEFRDIPGWPGDEVARALEPFLGTCRGLQHWGADRPLGGAGALARLGGTVAAFAGACAEAAEVAETARLSDLPAAADTPPGHGRLAEERDAAERQALVRDFFERRFRPFAAGSGLMTGYYEPELRGAEYPVGAFQVPLHAPPAPLEVEEPLPDRAAIEAGALAGMGLELAWVDDPVDAFFLHIQGSGRLRLHDGRLLRVGYAGQNGRPYKAIGKLLIDTGAVPRERMSMQAIRAWLAAAGPGEAADTLRHNPSYVFFRVLEGLPPGQGPPGALGVPLTPGRSLAVDPAFIPFGAPVFAATRDPLDGAPVRRLLHAQDTGGAIRGPARGDLFWGWDEAAAALAGAMRETAEVFVLVPRELTAGGVDPGGAAALLPEAPAGP